MRRIRYSGARHLEVMIGGCSPETFAQIREFLGARDFKLSESRHGTVLRLWADRDPTQGAVHRISNTPDLGPLPGLSEDESQMLRMEQEELAGE